MIDALFIGSADDTNDRHHHTNTGKNQPCYTHLNHHDMGLTVLSLLFTRFVNYYTGGSS